MYTDETLLTKGKHKFVRLSRVPADYLLTLYANGSNGDLLLKEYIKANYQKIIDRKDGVAETTDIDFPCNKCVYATEKLAKIFLNNIKDRQQDHKKPIRAYECPHCGGWHVTSAEYNPIRK